MQFVLCVFTSRQDAMALYDYCLRRRIGAQIVNTPREVSASCGISVRAQWQNRQGVVHVAEQLRTFAGAYALYDDGYRRQVTRL